MTAATCAGEDTRTATAASAARPLLHYSVVIPARNAGRALGRTLEALGAQSPKPLEVIVVDDGSTDDTCAIAEHLGATVITCERRTFAGGGRNRGWDAAGGDIVVFLDSDAIPEPGWAAGLAMAFEEFPGAVVGCARSFAADTPWGWVSHLQIETPYLARGAPRDVAFVSSYCMAVPRELPLRFDESYGGEDAVFCADALAAGVRLVFDPRFRAFHDHDRTSFADLRHQQARLARGLARCGPIQSEGLHKRVASRFPLHYFALVRLPVIYSRVKDDSVLRERFLRLLPRLVVAEWSLGICALKYVARRPPLVERPVRLEGAQA